MAYKYDPPRMKSGADSIEREIKTFNQLKQSMDSIVSSMSSKSWNDATNRRFVQRYNNDAKKAAEELSKTMSEFASLLKQCAKKYGNAIDNGNSNLSV